MRLRLAVALSAALVLPGATSAASDGWSQPAVLAPAYTGCVPAKCSTFPALSVNARGDAVAVFRHYVDFHMSRPSGFDCRFATKSRLDGWRPAETFPRGVCPVVALDFGGNAMAVWMEARGGKQVLLAQLHAAVGGKWLPGQRLSAATADASDVTVASGGVIVAAWSVDEGKTTSVQAAVRTSGRFGHAQTLWKVSGSPLIDIDIAVNDEGAAIVAWSTLDRGRGVAWTASRPAGGHWREAQPLAQPRSGYATTPAVALDTRGNAVAVWFESEKGLRSAFSPAGGRFGSARVLSPTGVAPNVSLDARGDALATWQEERSGVSVAVAAFRRSGRWHAAERISAPGARVGSVASAIAPSGRAIAVWVRNEFTSSGAARTVQAAVRESGRAFGAPQDISETGLLAGSVQVALDARGNGLVLWEGADGAVEAATHTN